MTDSAAEQRTATPRVFGLIPAAGASRRMGQPKQLLPLGESTLLGTVIESVLAAGLDGVVVVTHRQVDDALRLSLDKRFRTAIADDPNAEMLESILLGAGLLIDRHEPAEHDAFMVCPGDIAGVTKDLVARCATEYRNHPGSVVVAAIGDKPGHPLVVPFGLLGEVGSLRGVGLKRILVTQAACLRKVQAGDPKHMTDVDTPEDYRAL